MTLIIIVLHNECDDQLVHDYRVSSVPEMKVPIVAIHNTQLTGEYQMLG